MENEIFYKQEDVDKLEEEINELHAFIAEKSEDIELLEEKLREKNMQLAEREDKIQHMQEEINYLKNRNVILLDEIKSIKKPEEPDTNDNIDSKDGQRDIIKEQLSTKDQNTQTDDKKDENQAEERIIALEKENRELRTTEITSCIQSQLSLN
ncbi:uncharacterized protein LOC113464379 [Ceratina calcarata]|uniref:Uncharacterized protein LOC113464379 n=1 Tax=Ceratina calcarata TaxID=156304 RepID=A0AAJ7S1A4_9HYME|nr:uncharacterized protein LOC113464379 [Ceratina calcarata]XP_026669582.1 uncharacterized protein LOC113464379 [Ceratina calcarata]XP_026669583.1 uncharacterized protein LOC113464379 [Ceratina calcarata]XP_026669584.1 uncharacterized protein LOC113464379 [Ceratina calcarata]